MQLLKTACVSLSIAFLAACNSSEEVAQAEQAEAPRPVPVLTPSPTPTAAPDGTPLALGEWHITEDGTGSSAAFGQPNEPALLAITCDAATNNMSLIISGNAPGMQSYVVEAGSEAARLDLSPTGGAIPTLKAGIAINAPVFAGFTQPGNVISLTSPEGQTLRIPAAGGIYRVFADCSM